MSEFGSEKNSESKIKEKETTADNLYFIFIYYNKISLACFDDSVYKLK